MICEAILRKTLLTFLFLFFLFAKVKAYKTRIFLDNKIARV
jgi:hypothetical protein